MTLDELKAELESDLPIKLTELQSESANNPVLYGKYSRLLAGYCKNEVKLTNNHKTILKNKMMYYTGRGDDVCLDVFTPTELKTVLTGDDEIVKSNLMIEQNQLYIDFCRNAMEAIKQRGYSIRAIVDLRKLEAGE